MPAVRLLSAQPATKRSRRRSLETTFLDYHARLGRMLEARMLE